MGKKTKLVPSKEQGYVTTVDPKKKNDEKREMDQAEKDFNIDSELDETKANQTKVIEIGAIVTAPTKLGDWFLTNLIGEGTFARIFIGKNCPSEQFFAVKVESRVTSMDFTSNEITVMRCLTYPKELPHLPKPVAFVKRRTISYIAMTLLGENLRDLKLKCPDQRFLRGTWSRIGIQVLYAIKLIHEKGFIHRDIKPENLVMGSVEDQKRWRIVHVIDFGLARQWAWTTDSKAGKYHARPLRSKVSFRGSLNFASPTAHLCMEQGRRDDLWSLLFTLIDLNDRLPWFGIKEHSILAKQKTDAKIILVRMPRSFERIVDHLNGLSALQRPNYHMFFNILKDVLKESGQTPASKFTFENTELTADELQERIEAAWEEKKGTFFARDSINISSPKDCIGNKKKDWTAANVDDFESISYDLLEKTKKDGTKTKLYHEFRTVHRDETYQMRLEDSRIRVASHNVNVKEADRDQQRRDARNYLAEEAVCDLRKNLKAVQTNYLKNMPPDGKTDEQKEADINMGEMIVKRDDVLKNAQLNVIRMKKEAKEKGEEDQKKKE